MAARGSALVRLRMIEPLRPGKAPPSATPQRTSAAASISAKRTGARYGLFVSTANALLAQAWDPSPCPVLGPLRLSLGLREVHGAGEDRSLQSDAEAVALICCPMV